MVHWIKTVPPPLQEAVREHLQAAGNSVPEDDIFVDDGVGDDAENIADLKNQGKTIVCISDLG